MVRSVITIIVAALLIFVGAYFEHTAVNKSFSEMRVYLDSVAEKIEASNINEQDILSLQKFWIEKKKCLHVYLPHTELKELDLWIAECTTYAKFEKKEDALAKIEVVKELCEQVPQTFLVRIQNLF